MMRGSKAARLRPRFPRIVWSCSNWWNERAGVALAGGIPSPALHPNPQRLTLRSEEHTSELQSLMRISYAVFCLKKKKQKLTINTDAKIIDYIERATAIQNITDTQKK